MAARNPFASSIPDIYDPYSMINARPARLSTGYYIVRNLLLVGAIAGGLVALYRNDVFRELARRAGQEPRYLAVESSLVGTPGWGTPRSMEPVLAETGAASALAAPSVESPTSEPSRVAEMPATVATTSPAPELTAAAPVVAPPMPEPAPAPVAAAVVAPQAAAAPAPAAAAPAAPARLVDPLAPVSLDSLPVLTKGGAAKPVAFDALPTRAAPTPVARAAPTPVDRGKAKAIRVSLDEGPSGGRSAPTRAAAPPPAPEPAPVAKKPEPPKVKTTDAHKNDNPLMAAVRGAVRARPPKESVPAAD